MENGSRGVGARIYKNGKDYRPFALDDWSLDTSPFGDREDSPWDDNEDSLNLSLIELLANKEKEKDLEQPSVTLRTAFVQPTMKALIYLMSVTERASVSKIHRVGTKQGLLLIREEPQYKPIQTLFSTRLEMIRTTYNHDRATQVDQSVKLFPQDITVNERGNIRVYEWVNSELSKLSYCLGMHEASLAAFCLLYSLATVSNLGAYMPIVLSDINRFRERIATRSASLSERLRL